MFRTTKKKRTKVAVRKLLADDDDDEEGKDEDDYEPIAVLKKPLKGTVKVGGGGGGGAHRHQKANRVMIRSFQVNEEDDNDDDDDDEPNTKTSRRKKHHRGMGFGGGGVGVADHDSYTTQDEPTSALYDPGALSLLREEQSRYNNNNSQAAASAAAAAPRLRFDDDGANLAEAAAAAVAPEPVIMPQKKDPQLHMKAQTGDDYIPLDSQKKQPTSTASTILTGEEAFSYMQLDGDSAAALGNRPPFRPDAGDEDPMMIDDSTRGGIPFSQLAGTVQQVESSEAWENEISRRAGILHPPPLTARTSNKSLEVLDQLKTQIHETLQQMQGHDDYEERIRRRQGEIESNQASLQRYEQELKEAGQALEFYQHWRSRLCLWVGACRELRAKVEPITLALHELEGETAAVPRWKDWEDDMVAVLREHDLLDQVVGRQPLPVIETGHTIDEFGRDVQSQQSMDREKRRKKRRRAHRQRRCRAKSFDGDMEDAPTVDLSNPDYVRGDESDAFISDDEVEGFRGRHKALRKALEVAMDDLDEEFTVLQNLVDLFDDWRRVYPSEYKQCFASLSLVDLAGILVQVELCSLNDPWDESKGYNEAKWTSVIHSAREKGILDQQAVERLFSKCVLPVIFDLLDKEGINLTSSRQTRAFANFITHIQKLLPAESEIWNRLRDRLNAYTKAYMSSVAVPFVIKPNRDSSPIHYPEDLEEARYSATWGQLYRLKKVLLNLLSFWGPVMQEDEVFIDLILHFISAKFLSLLSSMQGLEEKGLSESPSDVFLAVYQSILETGWLVFPEFMLLAAPIRAAAKAYGAE